MKLCKFCEREVHCKEMCFKHYTKWRRVGKNEDLMFSHGNAIPIENRMLDFTIDENGCHLWNKGLNHSGYGKVKYEGRTLGTHTVAFFLKYGRWPLSDLDHTCHTIDLECVGGVECSHRRCINPEHLEEVTGLENSRRRDIRIGLDQNARVVKESKRTLPSVCGNGHEYTPDNTRITPSGHRSCRQCAREYAREYRKR